MSGRKGVECPLCGDPAVQWNNDATNYGASIPAGAVWLELCYTVDDDDYADGYIHFHDRNGDTLP